MIFLICPSKPQKTEEISCPYERMKEIANRGNIYQRMHNSAPFIH